MSWRIVLISSPSKLSVSNKQFIYQSQEKGSLKIPLEDIGVIIIESTQSLITSRLLASLADYNIVLFSCDLSHIPSGCFHAFHQHSRYSEIAWLQRDWSQPFKKRIWQQIITVKIQNQSSVLTSLMKDNAKMLYSLSRQVQSGDPTNREGYAAALYWKSLFGKFKRNDEGIYNKSLNYGYAILRGTIARYLVGSGFIPAFGVHHANKLNAFNLADDIIEPFRPFIDYHVYSMYQNIDFLNEELSPQDKQGLVSVLIRLCLFKEEQITILKACEVMIQSLSVATKENDFSLLSLPYFLER